MEKPIVKQIRKLRFSLFSPEMIKKIAVVKIVTPELYDIDGYPVDGGLMDLRLGSVSPNIRCRTCGGTLKECPGHFGYIELARPILHIHFIPLIDLCLRSTCQNCGRILLSEEDIRKGNIGKAKNTKKCPWCGAKQEKIKLEKPYTFYLGKKRIFPTEIRERLVRIPDEDLELLGVNPKTCRPEWAVLTLLLVPPVTVRPSITLETGERSEDDLTHKLNDIVRANQRLWENLNAGAAEPIIEDLWDLLQYHVTTFFNNNISNIPVARHRSGHPLKTLTERIKGKEGRIRHNLAGKRVNFSSRTVISPDPFIDLNEVGVPYEVAEVLTVPEKVTSYNKEYLKRLILNKEYPSAIAIIRPDGKKKKITNELRKEIAEEVDVGYIVERQLRDGDIVLFNRHPSLHRMSLMAHLVKVLPGRTFRIHPGTCFPYNADFDGDEMNIHVPQIEEARAEAKILLNVNEHLMSPKVNMNVIGCVEDAITGLYLLVQDKLKRKDAVQLLAEIGENIHFNKETIEGKEIFSSLLPKINFSMQTKACLKKKCPYYEKCKKEKCPYNGYLLIREGKLVCGVVDEEVIGVESKALTTELDKQLGREKTMEIIKKLFTLGINYLSLKGITIGLDSLTTTYELENNIKKVVKEAEKKVNEIIKDFYEGKMHPLPGKTLEETREIKILQVLNEVRTKAGEILKKGLDRDNPAYIMVLSGSRGSLIFLTQMGGIVGQQALWAKRIGLGFKNRTLSFYKQHDLSPRARGFIYSNYIRGLRPDEFFFTAMTGRDSLMDTALRTPKSGYLYRRIVNALQDMRVEYDGTVRDSNYNIIQFQYGEDGIDITKEHLNEKISPGEAVGVVTAESFGEPSTQMTLNVFHFAGISEMQITLGLPRLIEIFDARKEPSTPSMEIYLEKEYNNETGVKKIAAKIKQILFEEVIKEIKADFTSNKLEIFLNRDAMREYNLTVTKIFEKLKTKEFKARLHGEKIIIKPKQESFESLFKLKERVKKIIISGIKRITQVLPIKRGNEFVILTAGSNLKEVLKIKGVDKKKTTTNNFYEIADVFGIEAARQALLNEIKKVISTQGLEVNERHIKLIVDAMTSSGEIKGVTRVGIINDKASIIARASFETPIRHFVNAAINGLEDELVSVIENIVFNQPIPVGTGLPGLLVKVESHEKLIKRLIQQEGAITKKDKKE